MNLAGFKVYCLQTLQVTPATAYKYCYFIAYLEKHDINLRSDTLVPFFYQLRSEGRKANYLNKMILACRAFGKFTDNPDLQLIKKISVPRNEVITSILSTDEIQQLLDLPCDQQQCQDRYDYFTFLFQLLSRTGFRPIELLRLKVKDCNFGLNVFEIHAENSKTHTDRNVPIPREDVYKIKQIIKDKQSNDLLFTRMNGTPMITDDLSLKFRERVKRLGIKRHVNLYSLRHSAATRALHNSDVLTTQALLGHSDLNTTQKYIHLDIENVRQVLDRDELVKGNMPVPEVFKIIVNFVKNLVSGDSRLKVEVEETEDELVIRVKKRYDKK